MAWVREGKMNKVKFRLETKMKRKGRLKFINE